MYQNSLVSISEGALAPLTLTANLVTATPTPLFKSKKFKKLSSLFQPGGMDQLVHKILTGKNKKKLLASLQVKDDGSVTIKKSLKKGKKKSNKNHRHVNASSIHHVKKGKKGTGFGKFIKDKSKKDKKKLRAPSHGSASKISKKLKKGRKHGISTTPVSKQNASGKKVSKKMDKIKNKTSSSNSKALKRMNKKGKVSPKKVPPKVVSKLVHDIKKKTGKKVNGSKIQKLIRNVIKARTQLKPTHNRRRFSKKNKIIQRIIRKTLNKPKIARQVFKIEPKDKDENIKKKYEALEKSVNKDIAKQSHYNIKKDILKKIPKEKIDNLQPPYKKWWKSIL